MKDNQNRSILLVQKLYDRKTGPEWLPKGASGSYNKGRQYKNLKENSKGASGLARSPIRPARDCRKNGISDG